VPHPSRKDFKMVAAPVRLWREPAAEPDPALGQHGDEVLARADSQRSASRGLRRQGVI